MNTLIVSLLILRCKLLKNLQSSSDNKGFTLLEMLITVVILGILAAFAIPSYMATVDKFKYGDAQTKMNCMAKQLKAYRLENAFYPLDINRNIRPADDITCFEIQTNSFTNDKIPFNSQYDYERLTVTLPSGQGCATFIVFFGKDKLKVDTGSPISRSYFSRYDYTKFNFFYNQDDLIATVDIENKACTTTIP